MNRIAACFLLAVLAWTTTAASQSNSTSAKPSATTAWGECQRPIASANASGIFTFTVDYPLPGHQESGQPVENVPDPSWAVTVDGGDGEDIQRTLWYSTAGQDYADDLSINYDVCAFVFSSLPTNTLRLGQKDNGNCSSMLTKHCIQELTSVASDSALQWVRYSSPPPYQNLTAGVLSSICQYISSDLLDAAKEQCGDELGIGDYINTNTGILDFLGEETPSRCRMIVG